MKERWSFSKEKLISAEEGLKPTEPVTGKNICSCDRLIQFVKLVLYIELILFLGWSGYTLFQSNYPAFRDAKSSAVPTEELSVLKDLKDTLDTIKTKENDPLKENVISTETSPTNDQLNVQTAIKEVDFDGKTTNKIIVKVPSLDTSESKGSESLEDGSVMEWGFPFLWNIHKESGPFTDDSSETVHDSKFDDGFEHFYESNEKDESYNVSEFPRSSFEEETEQQNEKEKSSFSSEDVLSSAEIFNNLKKLYELIKATRKDQHLEILNEDDLSESWENLKTNKEPLLWEESTMSSIVLPNESNEEESFQKSVDFEKFDNSEGDDTISDSKFDFWTPPITLQFTVPVIEWESDEKMYYTDDSMETSTATTNEEDNSSVMDQKWGSLSNLPLDTITPLPKENIGLDAFTVDTKDEDTDSGTDKIWGSLANLYDDPTTPLLMESVVSEASNATSNDEDNGSGMDNMWGSFSNLYDDPATPLLMESVVSAAFNTTTNDEDNDSGMDNIWGSLSNLHSDAAPPLSKENVDLETSTAAISEEDNSSVMDKVWEPFPNMYRQFAKPLSVESVDKEKESIQFGPRLTNDDLTNRELCSLQFFNGIRVIKCSWNSVDSDHSSDSSSITESKSDSTMEEGHDAFLEKNYEFFDKFSRKENLPDNTELFNERSYIYDRDTIDKIEQESIQTSLSSTDSSEISETSKFEMSDIPASSAIKDSVVSPSRIFWHFPIEQNTF